MNKMANELAYATTVLRGTTSLTSNLKLENEDFWRENEISPETTSKTELPKIKLKTIRSVTKKIKLQEVAIQSEYGNALKICKIK